MFDERYGFTMGGGIFITNDALSRKRYRLLSTFYNILRVNKEAGNSARECIPASWPYVTAKFTPYHKTKTYPQPKLSGHNEQPQKVVP